MNCRRYACIDCSQPCTNYRCRQCNNREQRQHHLIIDRQLDQEYAMRNTTTSTMGDIGEEEEVEFEPLEVPQTQPVPEKVPESVPA